MKTTSWILAGTILMTAAFGTRPVSANLLTNGGLELAAPAVSAPDDFLMIQAPAGDSTTIPGWTISGAVDVVPSSYWQAAEGLDSIDMIGSTGLGTLSQTVTGLTAGAIYGISFDLAINPAFYDGENATTKQLQLTVTDPSSIVAATQLYQGTAGAATRTDMQYLTQLLSFTASASTETFSFAALTPLNIPAGILPANLACGPVLDNVDLELISGGNANLTTTPEPASLGLLAAGSLLLLRRKSASSR